MERKGFFICIEGLDKSGKTSQSIALVEALCKKGFDAVYTTEPSDGEIGKFIRNYILNRNDRVSPVVEALLFAADRADHVESTIKPLLKKGKIVVSDRYVYSSLAYQGAAGLSLDWIEKINKYAIMPDIAIYIDVPIKNLLKRYRKEKSVMEHVETQRKVEEIYIKLVCDEKLISVNGKRSLEEISQDILTKVLEKLRG